MKRKPVLGETLYSLNIGNAALRGREQVLTPYVVTKVGRKYFTLKEEVKSCYSLEFHLSSWRQKTDYCADHELWESESEWAEARETQRMYEVVKPFFSGYNRRPNFTHPDLQPLTDDQIRRIYQITQESQ